MPSQLPFMSDAGGDDRHTVGLELPIDDNEFADLLHFVQSSTSAILEPQGQDEPFNAPLATIPPRGSVSASHIAGLPMSSSTTQEKQHGNEWVDFGWIDENNEHSTSWSSTDIFQDRIPSTLADIDFAVEDGHLLKNSNLNCPVNSWFHQVPIKPTPSVESPQAQSPTLQQGNQEELDWADYISIPQENLTTSMNFHPVVFDNDKAAHAGAAISPPASSQGSPSFPTAPNLQLPVNPITVSSPIPPSAATAIDCKYSIQKRQRMHSIGTSQLRPKLNRILPCISPNVPPSHTSVCNSRPRPGLKHKDPASGPGTRRSSRSDEESLRRRRDYQRVAEQTRRHRLNSALKDLEALLPSRLAQEENKITSPALDTMVTGKRKEKAPSADQTKACVMELAIEYIKMLRTTLNEKNVRMRELGAVGSSIMM